MATEANFLPIMQQHIGFDGNQQISNLQFMTQKMDFYEQKLRPEIHHHINLQNEKLRILLEEQRKQRLVYLLKKVELETMPLLKQKDEEISQATRRNLELEETAKTLEKENETWKRTAQENEAMIVSLNNKFGQGTRQINVSSCESCNDKNMAKVKSLCIGCESRDSCMLFLPCRHLCLCQVCESFFKYCPVCQMEKKACIQALMV